MLLSWIIVVLSVTTGGAEEELPWWRTATIYQVYPRSFKDSNGDGSGDLRGITEHVDHFKDIGVTAIWINPIMESPMGDNGYDIVNWRNIQPVFGTMEDFDYLLAKLKKIGLKLLMDFVPNHTSVQHKWFQASMNKSHPLHEVYKDFYIWHDGNGTTLDKQPIPPNNWRTIFGGPTWQWCEERQQFYLHQFLPIEADLNYRNPDVVSNITEFLNFWLDKGVDGFRVDAPAHMFEHEEFPNEPAVPGTAGDSWFTIDHIYTMNQPESKAMLTYWTNLLYERSIREKRDIALFLEVFGTIEEVTSYYGVGNGSLKIPFDLQFMFFMRDIKDSLFVTPAEIKKMVDQWMVNMPQDGTANWVIGTQDLKRLPDRFGTEMVDTMNMLTGILPGVKCVYYGEEIGMPSSDLTFNQTVDPWARRLGPDHYTEWSRDFERTPMQWDNSVNAGFSTNETTWLPVNPNYWYLNVAAQKAAPISHLKVFQAMTKARQDPVLQRGDANMVVPDNDTLLVVRSYNGSFHTMVTNLGYFPATYTSQSLLTPLGLDMDMTVVVASMNSDYEPGVYFHKGSLNITLKPKASVWFQSGSIRSGIIRSTSTVFLIFTAILVAISREL